MSAARPSEAPRGFTLLEVLVAVAILAIVLTTVYGVLARTIRDANRAEERADLYASGREAVLRIADDLERALPPKAGRGVYFVGAPGQGQVPNDAVLFFAEVRRDVSGTQRSGGRAKVIYQLDPVKDRNGVFALLRSETLVTPDSAGSSDGSDGSQADGESVSDDEEEGEGVQRDLHAYLLEEVSALRLRYLDPETGSFVNAWDTTEEVERGKRPKGLPGIVEITIFLTDANGGMHDFSTRVDLPLFEPPPTPGPGVAR